MIDLYSASNAGIRLMLVSVLASCAGLGRADVAMVRLLETCPPSREACVPMTISAECLEGLLERESTQDADGYTEFLARSRGSLAGGPVREHVLSIRGYTDGIACTSFGQSNVAVVALAESGRTTVLSESGELVLEPDALTIGCPDCIAPSNGRSYRRSPAWDLTLTGHRPEQFFQTLDGLVAIETGDGCIVLSDPLVHRSPRKCASLRSPIPLEIELGACT